MGRANDPKDQKYQRRDEPSKRAAANILKKVGVSVELLDRYIADPPDGETFIDSIQFKVGASWDDGILAIVKKNGSDGKKVGFHGADSLLECVLGLSSRLANGSMKWKEDRPYDSRTNEPERP